MRPAGFEGRQAVSRPAEHPRRPVHAVRQRLLRRVPGVRGAGYVVVYSNPRGSSGLLRSVGHARSAVRGSAGAGLGHRRLRRRHGRRPTKLCAGSTSAIRNALGVMGGSYGGYMTSWIVSHTDRFKAACSERAVNAWLLDARLVRHRLAASQRRSVVHLDDPDDEWTSACHPHLRDERSGRRC